MIRVGIVGLGKMGVSHYSIAGANPEVDVVAACDSSSYLLSVISRYNGVRTFTDLSKMLEASDLDAVVISTPSSLHASMVRTALAHGVNVFCEKPFCLDPAISQELTDLAAERGLVTQVGYHNRFVGAFTEVKRLLEFGALGEVTHLLAEAYGPVVLKQKGGTWRSKKSEGGGALYDYAAHPLDLMTWYFGAPSAARGTVLGKVFSRETEDEVFGTLIWPGSGSGQLSVSWSDDSQRKMTTKITAWGTNGRIFVDRQECQVYLRDGSMAPPKYKTGWNVRYTTELTSPVDFYLRGEEYSAQMNAFVRRVATSTLEGLNDFASATITDRVLAMMVADAKGRTTDETVAVARRDRFLQRARQRA